MTDYTITNNMHQLSSDDIELSKLLEVWENAPNPGSVSKDEFEDWVERVPELMKNVERKNNNIEQSDLFIGDLGDHSVKFIHDLKEKYPNAKISADLTIRYDQDKEITFSVW